MKLQHITDSSLPILEIQNVVKGHVTKGRIIPSFQYRHADMLGYVYSGEVIYYFSDGYTVPLHSGEAIYLPKGSNYYYDVFSDLYEYVYTDFVFGFPSDSRGHGEAFELKGMGQSFQNILMQMNSKWLMKQTGYYEECMGNLYRAYAKLIQLKCSRYTSLKTRMLPEQCAVYIQDHYSDVDFKVGDLNMITGCSDVHTRRTFKDYFGMSPSLYLLNIRIQNAKILLESTDYNIEQIAKLVGFNDPYYFSRSFRKLVGCCPTTYRKNSSQG